MAKELEPTIRAISANFKGEVGCFARDLVTGREAGYRPDAVMPVASAIKLLVLIELYRRSIEGDLDLEEQLTVSEKDWERGSGILRELMPGLRLSIRDLARLMIILSDNVATAKILRLVGLRAVNALAGSLGLEHTEFFLSTKEGARGYAVSTPRELVRIVELLATDQILTSAACAEIREMLGRQLYLEQIPRLLPANRYAEDLGLEAEAVVQNKPGFSVGVRSDVAIVETSRGVFVIAIIAEWDETDIQYHVDQEANLVNARLARCVYDAWRR